MQEQEAVRRLVKSPPELWAQCSDPASLARHLSGFGEITITRLEPEITVAWEGESARGTVTLEASGWGTRVRLTAAPPLPVTLEILSEPVLASRGLIGLISSLRRPGRDLPYAGVADDAQELKTPEVAPSTDSLSLVAELEAALDSLGQAHHRPYSRS